MKRAVIDGSGQVVNVVVLPTDWTGAGDRDWRPPPGHRVVTADGARIGDTSDGASPAAANAEPERRDARPSLDPSVPVLARALVAFVGDVKPDHDSDDLREIKRLLAQ